MDASSLTRSPRRLVSDVVIIGFGGAGAVAAIEASRLGADVILVERAPKGLEGGNTRVSAQGFLNPRSPAATEIYLNALSCGIPIKPARIRTWAEEACRNAAWLESRGIRTEELRSDSSHAEYPEFVGSDTIVKRRVVATSGLNLWTSLKSQVEKSGIHVEFGWRAIRLGKNTAGRITDVLCSDGHGRYLNLTGRRGVILATGGFAASRRLLARYAPLTGTPASAGCPHNVGDGLMMTAPLGARWTGLEAVAGPYLAFLPPGYKSTVPIEPLLPRAKVSGGFMLTDATSNRLMIAKTVTRHGWVSKDARTWTKVMLPARAHFVCDADLLSTTALVQNLPKTAGAGWCRAVEGLRWSHDNLRERHLGWISESVALSARRAHSIIKQSAPVRYGAPGGGGRINGPPFFTLRLVPSILNTQGGPERDEFCRVIDKAGMPIEGLYAAGELGSIFPGLYQGSGNLADCLVSGRIAARSALTLP